MSAEILTKNNEVKITESDSEYDEDYYFRARYGKPSKSFKKNLPCILVVGLSLMAFSAVGIFSILAYNRGSLNVCASSDNIDPGTGEVVLADSAYYNENDDNTKFLSAGAKAGITVGSIAAAAAATVGIMFCVGEPECLTTCCGACATGDKQLRGSGVFDELKKVVGLKQKVRNTLPKDIKPNTLVVNTDPRYRGIVYQTVGEMKDNGEVSAKGNVPTQKVRFYKAVREIPDELKVPQSFDARDLTTLFAAGDIIRKKSNAVSVRPGHVIARDDDSDDEWYKLTESVLVKRGGRPAWKAVRANKETGAQVWSKVFTLKEVELRAEDATSMQ